MAELSPAAWAVAAAASVARDHGRSPIAAALLALADQVAPVDGSRRTQEIRADILAIATELENHQ